MTAGELETGTSSSFAPPTLDVTQQRILEELRRDGISVLRYEELLDEPAPAKLQADVAPFVAQSEERARAAGPAPRKKSDFIIRRFVDKSDDAPEPTFTLDSVWLRVGASERVLDIVNSYRGEPTRLHHVDNWFTVPFSGADSRVGSQRWHRDPEEEHVVKLFLYLSDVDEDAGPFEYVRGSFAGGRYGHLWPWNKDDRYPPEAELYDSIDPADRVAVTGSAWTMLTCDTGGFHRGGFARTKPRVLATWSYVSLSKRGHRRFVVDLDRPEAELPDQVRTALC